MSRVPRRKLHVGFVAWRDLAHPQADASEVVVDRLLRGLQARGHDVRLMCGGPVGERPYPVHAIGGTHLRYARASMTHARRLRRADVLVDVQNDTPFFSPVWRRRPSISLVHHIHAETWGRHFPRPAAALGRPLASRGRRYVAVSPGSAAALSGLGIDSEQVYVVPNGVDPTDRVAARAPEPTFLALGRLVAHKRIGLLLRAWDGVRARIGGGRLVIAGAGPELESLREQAGDGVEVLGSVTGADKRRLLSEAWMLVHPAAHEDFGIVVLEAAMMQTPTLAFDVTGVRDSVRDGDTGRLVADEAQFADAWVELARDHETREAMGRAARSWAEGFTWEQSVERLEGVLQETVR